MSEIVPDVRYGGFGVRESAEKEEVAEEIRAALLGIARLHVRETAFTTDDHGYKFHDERYLLSSVKWMQFPHRSNEADLYLKMSGSIRQALRLPQHARLIAHAQFQPEWHAHDAVWEAVGKNIRYYGLNETIVSVCLPWIDTEYLDFYGCHLIDLRSRLASLTGLVDELLFNVAASSGH